MRGGPVKRLLVIPLLLFLALTTTAPSPARAEGGASCKRHNQFGECIVWDNNPPRTPPRKGGGNRNIVDYPKCSSIPGGFTELPGSVADNETKKDWHKVKCRGDSGKIEFVWVDGNSLTLTVSPEVIARSLLAQMNLRGIRIGMVPDNCSGCRGAVGMPIWLWVDQPSRTTWGPASISAGGVSLTARVTQVRWAFGNGDSITCGLGTAYRDSYGVSKSPSCGYSYSKQGTYDVTATSSWTAEWNGYGQSGTINFTLDSTRTNVTIGEIQVTVTNGKPRR